MQYNLIKNGILKTLTVSGTGNKVLSWPQLEILQDGNTTSSGITIINSDILWLECDLSDRIKIDGIHLYANDLTKLSDISFYYKNTSNDSYIACNKAVSDYYYATIPSPSAPRYLLATVSGIDIELYEFLIYNDDYIVAFGSDGTEYVKYLDNTPIGIVGDSSTIAIYNNSTELIPADAYICIDYTGSKADEYIKISNSESGTYYGIKDGSLIEDDKDSSIYKWSMGKFDNVKVSADKLILDNVTIVTGTYKSPIFKLDSPYQASYFIIDTTTESGTTNVSYDSNTYNGTIRIKSSNTVPLDVDEIYWGHYNKKLLRGIIYNNDINYTWHDTLPANAVYIYCVAVDRRNGNICIGHQQYGSCRMSLLDRNGNLLYVSKTITPASIMIDINMEFDKFGGIWSYGNSYILNHVSSDLSTTFYSLSITSDFLHDFAVEVGDYGDGGIWYTDKNSNYLAHISSDGTILKNIIMVEPRAICATNDGGCWVVDNGIPEARRYDFSGNLIKTIAMSRGADRLTMDMENSFWYIEGNYIYHMNSNGSEDIIVSLAAPSRIKGGYNGCLVWSESNDWAKYIDKVTGTVSRTFTPDPSTNHTGIPALFSFKYDDFVKFKNPGIIPAWYDPIWYEGGSLDWIEVRKDGYFLTKNRFHQTELTLLNNDSSSTPSVNKIIISPSIKVEDIPAKNSKNIYIKTDIPVDANIDDYETKIRAWWGIKE